MEKFENVTYFNHPLIQHKISILRKKETGTNEFRHLVEEIAMLEGFEALNDLPLEEVEIETPIEKCKTPMIAGRKLAIVPILRAGLGMVEGILGLQRSVISVSTVTKKPSSLMNTTANCLARSKNVPSLSATQCWQQAVLLLMPSP